jgi:DNA-binding MarR family transcriptional regulator
VREKFFGQTSSEEIPLALSGMGKVSHVLAQQHPETRYADSEYPAWISRQVVSAVCEETLASRHFNKVELNVLLTLTLLGPCAQRDLRRLLRMDKSKLCRYVARMCARGWLVPGKSTAERIRPLILTERGEQVLRDAYRLWREARAGASERVREALQEDESPRGYSRGQ